MITKLPGSINSSKLWLILCFALLLARAGLAQDYTEHIWYFGNSQYGIIFNKSDDQPNQADDQATPFGNAGSAVATDQVSGDLLFYTDGDVVYDASHQVMAGWAALSGNNAANQGVAISPRPNNPDQYYIFTNTASYPAPGNVFFSTVNMSLDGNATPPEPPLGEITNLNNPATLPDGIQVNPGMLVFEVGNDPYQYFLLVQNAANGDYHLYSIGPAGNTLVKTIPNPTGLVAGNFAIHPQTGQIAVSPQNSGANIQILQFDLATDTLGVVREIPNSGNFDTAGQAVYDVEFSPNGNNIYISRFGDGTQEGVLYRYDLNDSIASLDQVNPNSLFRSFGLQIGPDGRIYHLYQENSGGPIQVGRITNPNDTTLSNIVYQAVPTGNENYDSRLFPSFAPKSTINLNSGFEVVTANTCERSPTKFYPTFDPPAEFYQWDFGDPMSPDNSSNLIAPIHTYSAPGSYQVQLIAGINGSVDTVYQNVTVIAMPDSIDLGQDTVICPNESLVLDAGNTWDLIRWSIDGETGSTVTIDSSIATGYIWVVATKGNCTAYDGINVEEYGEMVQNANYWYFGQNAGINFNEQPPVAVSDGQLITPEGAATISDQNGDLYFYTDGNVVYDRDHVQMDNGIQIGGENGSTQSSIIIPFPNDETLFYVFTTRAVFDAGNEYALEYSVVDIKEIGGGTFGSVVTKEKQLFERSTERLTATNPGGFVWLIAHEMGNNTFRAYPITDQGIGSPVLTSIGSVHDANNAEESQGYMKLSTDGTRLAVAVTKGGVNYVEIFDFDAATGTLSNYLQIEIPADYPQVYGVEFSSDSDKLFVTTNTPGGSGSKLYELKLYDYDKDSVESRIVELQEESGVNMGAIQTGPDGQIYVARDGEQFLGTIIENLDTLSNSTYNSSGFDLVTGTSSLGLPNFVQSYFQQTPQATATVIPACINQTTTFIGQGTSIIDQFLWTFGDGGTATTDSASHVYLLDSVYTVSFNVSNRCGLNTTITQMVDISGYPDDATIDPVEVLCDGPLVLDADTTNAGGKQFIWSTGATTQSIQVTSPGIFSVRIINAAGCVSEDTTQVFDGRPPVDLGPNRTICQGDSLVLSAGLPVGTPPNTFTWYIDGLSQGAGTNNSLTVNTNTTGTFEFIVNVVDGLTACVGEDTVLVTINPTPTATYTVQNSTCGNVDGQITVTSPLTNLTAEYFDMTNASLGTGAISPLIPAGTYNLVVTDNLSACDQTYAISVVDAIVAFTFDSVTPRQDCGGDTLDVQLSGVTIPATINYTLIETGSATVTTGIPGASTFSIPVSFPGNYTLQVQADGCTDDSTNIVFNPRINLPLQVAAIMDLCSDNSIVSVTNPVAGLTYTWTGPGGFFGSGASVPVSVSGQYFVTVSDGDDVSPCDTTAAVQVNIFTSPDPLINPLTPGCDGTRQVGVSGLTGTNYSYSWTNNSTGQVVSSAPSITITTSAEYLVTVRDQLTGCQGDDLQQVDVYQLLSVAVTVDRQACQDNNMVTLSATVMPTQNVKYEWFLNEVQLRDTLNFVQTFNEGLYRAEVTDAATGNCTASGELLITRAPVTPSNIEPLYIICPEPPANEVALIDAGDFITYLAFNMETGQEVYETMPGIFEIIEEGEYNFELENEFNCWTLDTTRVEVDCIPTIYAPNAFSPNAQMQENQTFRLYPTFVGDFEIFIYNRWGELVFYTDDLDFMVNIGWDGVKNGKSLPLGTYAYVIKYRSVTEPERGVLEKPGGITLIR
jgi:gliding motility-associated-like protein